MNKTLKQPLKQAGLLVAGAFMMIACLGITGSGITGIFQLLLWAFGLTLGIGLAIGVMTGIFFAAVAMTDRKSASLLWSSFAARLGLA